MPYRCQKCMNTFKTLSLYNRHATDCKCVKGEGGGQQQNTIRTQSGSVVVKRTIADSGGPDSKRINAKIEFRTVGGPSRSSNNDDEIQIICKDSKDNVKQEIVKTVTNNNEGKKQFTIVTNNSAGPKLYRCFECDAAFDTKNNLETHVREGHKDKFCDECEDDFSWPDSSHDCYYTRYQLRFISGDIVPSF